MDTSKVDNLDTILQEPSLAPYREALQASRRACWKLRVQRIARLRPSIIGRLFGRSKAEPTLSPLASKMGGSPYLESKNDWPRDKSGRQLPFVGQLNFAEFPPLEDHPGQGILSVYRADYDPDFVSTWHAFPKEQTAPINGPSDGAWECRLTADLAESVSMASWTHKEDPEGAFGQLMDWDVDQSGDVGRWAPANSLDIMEQSKSDEQWIQVWDELWHESFGSATSSLQVPLREYKLGDLSNVRDERWQ